MTLPLSTLSWLRVSTHFHSSQCRQFRSIWLGSTSRRSLGAISRAGRLSQSTATTVERDLTHRHSSLRRSIHSSPPRQDNSVTVEVGGSSITISTGRFAKLADGSALLQCGNTSVLVTAVSDKKSDDQARWLPLIVDYRDRGSAANKIPRTFFRRELRPSTKEYLASRFIDRSIRPLFPDGYYYNTQVICNMLSMDGHQDHEILAVNGAAAALMLSDIPWNGPVGAVRVCLIEDKFCINPSSKLQSSSQLNVIVTCTKDKIVMVEGCAEEIGEDRLCEAVEFGFNEAQSLIASLSELVKYRKAPTRDFIPILPSPEVKERVKKFCWPELVSILSHTSHSKTSRDEHLFSLLDRARAEMAGTGSNGVPDAFWMAVKQCMQELVLEKGIRCDGRGVTELRDIECEVDTFKTLHGSAVFKRGESQVLCTVTFDSPSSAAKADILQLLLGAQKTNKFLMHYEFPPFATNTIGFFMNHSRREAGHGALAEKALASLIPPDFPFTIRVNSQVLDSNGSTSMATICGGSLALFDAGVPMPRAAGGVACGLMARTNPVSGEIEKYQILTDILGIEDANGNMDFKIGGTRKGITSLQMDVKGLSGLPLLIFKEAVMQSKAARYQVLDIMDKCQSVPREDVKDNGPACTILEIPQDKLGKLLGVGAHRLRAMADETGASFTILGEGKISIFAPSQEAMDDFREKVDSVLSEELVDFEIGSVIEATVLEIREHGIMVEIAPRVSSLLHISKISTEFVSHPADVGLRPGDSVNVKYLGKDFLGRHQISRKALLQGEASESSDKPSRRRETEFEVGQVIEATVKEIRDIGLMVELTPGVVCLLHIKNLAHEFVFHPADLKFKPGDTVTVKYVGKDPKGRPDVSRKALLPPPPNFVGHRRRHFGPERTL